MNLQKPIWLVIVAVIAIFCFEVAFRPVRWVSKPEEGVPSELRYEVDKKLVEKHEQKADAEERIRELLLEKIPPDSLDKVQIFGDKILHVEVIALDMEEFESYARDAKEILKAEFRGAKRIEKKKKKEEKYVATVGPLGISWPPRPQVKLGLDLRGGLRLVLRLLPTTTYNFTAEKPLFETDEERLQLVKELTEDIEELGYEHVDVTLPGEKEEERKKVNIILGTPTAKGAKRAGTVLRNLLTKRFGTLKMDKDSTTITSSTMDKALGVIERRVNGLGVAEATVQRQGLDRVAVSLPGLTDPSYAITVLRKFAKLEFRHIPRIYELAGRTEEEEIEFQKKGTKEFVPSEQVLAASTYILGGRDLKPGCTVVPRNGGWAVGFEFKPDPAKEFSKFTRQHKDEYLAIILDGEIVSCPSIETQIRGPGIIRGMRNIDEATKLANWLNAGALPVPLELAETREVSATLGTDTVHKSLLAGLWGLLLVVAFMVLYYRFCGLLADLALGIYCLLVLTVVVAIPVTLTLPGIAGFILSIGMAVDANVLIFERLKEELRTEKGIRAAIDSGFKRAWTAILDCNITTLLVCAVLYILGTGAVKGFALTLSIGILCSLFSAITITRVFVNWASRSEKLVQSRLFVRT